jgi:hypothetical protein
MSQIVYFDGRRSGDRTNVRPSDNGSTMAEKQFLLSQDFAATILSAVKRMPDDEFVRQCLSAAQILSASVAGEAAMRMLMALYDSELNRRPALVARVADKFPIPF